MENMHAITLLHNAIGTHSLPCKRISFHRSVDGMHIPPTRPMSVVTFRPFRSHADVSDERHLIGGWRRCRFNRGYGSGASHHDDHLVEPASTPRATK